MVFYVPVCVCVCSANGRTTQSVFVARCWSGQLAKSSRMAGCLHKRESQQVPNLRQEISHSSVCFSMQLCLRVCVRGGERENASPVLLSRGTGRPECR